MAARFLFNLVKNIPLSKAAANRLRRTGPAIFMLHRVLPGGEACFDPEMATSTELFAAFLDWISDHYRVVPLEDIAKRNGQDPYAKKSLCAITFDDGWRDNFLHALPLLEKHQFPATVFLCIRYVGTELRFWQERLWFCLEELRKRNDELETSLDVVTRSSPWCPQFTGQKLTFGRLRQFLLSRPTQEAVQFVDELVARAGPGVVPTGRAFMDWDEVRAMRDSGISFGSHTLHHVLLTRTTPEIARREIESSRRELEDRLGELAAGFSYPWGRTSGQIRQHVREAGYSFAVTTRAKLVADPFDPWLLPRVPISSSVLRDRDGFDPRKANFYIASKALGQRKRSAGAPNGFSSRGPVRIAFLIDQINSWEAGTEQQLGKLLGALDRRYFQPELYFFNPSRSLGPQDFPCPIHVIGSRRENHGSRLGVLRRLVQLLKQQRPQIVQTILPGATFYGTLAAWWVGAPIIVSTRRNSGYWQTAATRVGLTVVNALVDYWQCNSRAVYDVLITDERIPADAIEILPNAIDLERFLPTTLEERLAARSQLGVSASATVFVSVANLSPVKDLATLVQAASNVQGSVPDPQFFLIGDGPLHNSLVAQIEGLGLAGSVHLAGRKTNVRPFLVAADVGILTSRSEGAANAVLEYMAMGLPVVVSDIPANRELVEGLFFEPGNAADLSDKLIRLWNDPNLRKQMRAEHHERAAAYGFEAFALRAQSYYMKLAAELL